MSSELEAAFDELKRLDNLLAIVRSIKEPEPDACGHGDDPDETCDGCYG